MLPYDLLLARVDDTLSYHLSVKTLSEPGDLYAGYDVGRKRDLSVLVVLERIKKEFRWRGAVELREAPFDEQFELLASVLKERGLLRRLAIDQSGLGMQLAEELVRRHGSRVEPITMTAPVKESLASRILAVFQRGDLSIPDHRPLIDMLGLTDRTVGLHGDVFDGAVHGHARYNTDYVFRRKPDIVLYHSSGRFTEPVYADPEGIPFHTGYALFDFVTNRRCVERYAYMSVGLDDGTLIEMQKRHTPPAGPIAWIDR